MVDEPAKPRVIVIGGPNGAGKSTLARTLVPADLEFVNADEVAKSLQAGQTGGSTSVDVAAGRLVLRQLDELEREERSFALETTLASRTLAPRIARLRESGYEFILYYVWVPSPVLSVARVADRVRMGGHHIPTDVIYRRYARGLINFSTIYRKLADAWFLLDNSVLGNLRMIAEGGLSTDEIVYDSEAWTKIWENLEEDTNE